MTPDANIFCQPTPALADANASAGGGSTIYTPVVLTVTLAWNGTFNNDDAAEWTFASDPGYVPPFWEWNTSMDGVTWTGPGPFATDSQDYWFGDSPGMTFGNLASNDVIARFFRMRPVDASGNALTDWSNVIDMWGTFNFPAPTIIQVTNNSEGSIAKTSLETPPDSWEFWSGTDSSGNPDDNPDIWGDGSYGGTTEDGGTYFFADIDNGNFTGTYSICRYWLGGVASAWSNILHFSQ